MESFEDLGLSPELVEALASDGIEVPTAFQVDAIPVIRRGNHLLGKAGPGGGTLIAYGAALLDRLEAGTGAPRAIVVAPTADSARRLAEALAAVATVTGHVVAAAGSPWAVPERADILFGAPGELLSWARTGRLRLAEVEALVIDQAAVIQRTSGLADLEALLEFLPGEAQRVVLALPLTTEVQDFVERHLRRAVQIPAGSNADSGPGRGEVRYRIVDEPREIGALALVVELLEDARHACLFFASEDRAADVGDFLQLHGFGAGAPGDEAAPVWLAVNELAARPALGLGEVVAVSYDPPAGPDSLDRRHGGGLGGVVVLLPREVPHLRDVSRRTGYRVVPFPPPVSGRAREDLDALVARLEAAGDEADLTPWLIALEPLFAKRGAAEVAAAAVALLRERVPASEAALGGPRERAAASAAAIKAGRTKGAPAPVAFVRLYVSLGGRDGAGPRDLLGAITGEAGVDGSLVGKIEMRDTFTIVEVQEPIAAKVIGALNGITIRGRSVRADYDRGPSARKPEGGRARGAGPRRGARAGPPGKPSARKPGPRGSGRDEGTQ